jgi:hypothetical protein
MLRLVEDRLCLPVEPRGSSNLIDYIFLSELVITVENLYKSCGGQIFSGQT